MAPKTRNQRLNGLHPLSYVGVNPTTPTNFIVNPRAPTINDYAEFDLGDIWLDDSSAPIPPNSADIYMLVDKEGGIATWVNFASSASALQTLTGNTGGAIAGDGADNINLPGAHGINTAGNAGSNTITIAINNAITLGDLVPLAANVAALTIASGDITFTATNNVGNLNMVTTHSSGNAGVIEFGGTRFIHKFGTNNTFVGEGAGNFTLTGINNTMGGVISGQALTTGATNTAWGESTLGNCTSGMNNTAIGNRALNNITSGSNNTAVGALTGAGLLFNGSFNYLMNIGAIPIAYNASESSNMLFNNPGIAAENNTMRIGTSGAGNGQQNRCFIAAIRGITTGIANAIPVLIDSAGQLGTVSSSIRYKENVADMDDVSSPVFELRPVTFHFKSQEKKSIQYGLIAEEVEKVLPDLVIRDQEGLPAAVRYHDLPILLLNELQKLCKRIEELEERIASQSHYD